MLPVLSVFITSINAQMEYSVNGGVTAAEGWSVSAEGSYPFKKKLEIVNTLQIYSRPFLSKYSWDPAPQNSLFPLFTYKVLRMNLISEMDYKILPSIRFGAGVNCGVRLHQSAETNTGKSLMTINIPEQSNMSLIALGVSSKLRFNIRRFYFQVRFIQMLNNTWKYDLFDDGERVQGQTKARDIHFLIGFKF